MLKSTFQLNNGTITPPILNFCLYLGLECTQTHRFVQYTHLKCFINFVQSAVNVRRKRDENPHSGVVAETRKLLANGSYRCQTMDRCWQTMTKYLNVEKAPKAINNKFIKRRSYLKDNLYVVESIESNVEHKEPIIAGLFIVQSAKLRMLELFHNFCHKLWDFCSFEEKEMDTDSLYLPLAHNSPEDCIRTELKDFWNTIQNNDCSIEFSANSISDFFHQKGCERHIKHNKREPRLFKEEFRCVDKVCLWRKTDCCLDKSTDKIKFSGKSLNGRTLEETGAGPLEKDRPLLDEKTNIQSRNRSSRTTQRYVCTYEHTRRRRSDFYPKRLFSTTEMTKSFLL